MLGHLGINVGDLELARTYYDQLMPRLDFEIFLTDTSQRAYRPANNKPGTYVFLYPASDRTPYSPDRIGLQHVAFMVRTRRAVIDVHRLAIDLGSRELHAPQPFPQYSPDYYAAFWRDPFGMALEAVCHRRGEP